MGCGARSRLISAAGALAVAVAAIVIGSATYVAGGALQVVERDVYVMGTRARLLTYATSRAAGLATLERALTAIEATEEELSTWRDTSAISTLNRQPLDIPWLAKPQLCAALEVLYDWHKQTEGSFDPGIGKLVQAWDLHGAGRIPSSGELKAARSLSGLSLLDFDQSACTLTRRQDVTIDVGAWGKGEALDRVDQALDDEPPWLIDLGGQISVGGTPPHGTGWTVSLAHPLNRQNPELELEMPEGSLATSAGSERDLRVNGRRVAHQLDPRTGKPASFAGSVTVWHRSGLVADVLSTALYVMGPDEGIPWAEQRGLSVCYLIPEAQGSAGVKMTTAFRRLFAGFR